MIGSDSSCQEASYGLTYPYTGDIAITIYCDVPKVSLTRSYTLEVADDRQYVIFQCVCSFCIMGCIYVFTFRGSGIFSAMRSCLPLPHIKFDVIYFIFLELFLLYILIFFQLFIPCSFPYLTWYISELIIAVCRHFHILKMNNK